MVSEVTFDMPICLIVHQVDSLVHVLSTQHNHESVLFMFMSESEYSIVATAFSELTSIIRDDCGLYSAHVLL